MMDRVAFEVAPEEINKAVSNNLGKMQPQSFIRPLLYYSLPTKAQMKLFHMQILIFDSVMRPPLYCG